MVTSVTSNIIDNNTEIIPHSAERTFQLILQDRTMDGNPRHGITVLNLCYVRALGF